MPHPGSVWGAAARWTRSPAGDRWGMLNAAPSCRFCPAGWRKRELRNRNSERQNDLTGATAKAIPAAPPSSSQVIHMRTDEPRAIHLKDYRAPEFHISKIDLDFVLEPDATRVAAKMQVKR